jgi:hypothetical protein
MRDIDAGRFSRDRPVSFFTQTFSANDFRRRSSAPQPRCSNTRNSPRSKFASLANSVSRSRTSLVVGKRCNISDSDRFMLSIATPPQPTKSTLNSR